MPTEFSRRVIALIRQVPPGCVASYGQIASLAGSPRGARQVVRLLHSASDKHGLPWHRVVNAQGRIPERAGGGHVRQAELLAAEGVEVSPGYRIDLRRYGWDFPERVD